MPGNERSTSIIPQALWYRTTLLHLITDSPSAESINQPRNAEPVPERDEERLQSRAGQGELVELLDSVYELELVLARLLAQGVDVGGEASAQNIVRDNESTRSQQPVGASGLGAFQELLQIAGVSRLVCVDEDDVVGLGGVELGEAGRVRPGSLYGEGECSRLGGGTDDDFNVLDALGSECLVGQIGVLGLVLEPRDEPVGPDGVSPNQGRVSNIDANLQDWSCQLPLAVHKLLPSFVRLTSLGIGRFGQDVVELRLEIGAHVVGVVAGRRDGLVVRGDGSGQRRRVPFRVVGHLFAELGVGVEGDFVELHIEEVVMLICLYRSVQRLLAYRMSRMKA